MSQKSLAFPQPLSEKHRPRKVSGFVGLEKPKRVLEAYIERPFDCAFLFVGPSGIGKTTVALAMADEMNAELHHVPSRSADLETMETITHMCWSSAFNFRTGKQCSRHLVLVDEADAMSDAAQKYLLSKLDSTALIPLTTWVFTCNATGNLEDRFTSRCRRLDFKNEFRDGELEDYLAAIYKKEGGKYPLSFVEIVKNADHNVRQALSTIETELLIGANRSDLPPEEELILEEHTHNCKKCHRTWKHREPKCELPYRHDCAQCGGTTTNGQERAKKAWKTIRAKIAAEVAQAKPKAKRA